MLKATAAGRIGRDAEQRTAGQHQVVNFTVAIDKRKGQEKVAVWLDCNFWGDRAVKLKQYLTKGSVVAVAGDIELQEFQKRDGTGGSKLSMRVDDITLLGGGKRDDQQAPAGSYDQSPPRQSTGSGGGSGHARPRDDIDDEIPF